MVNWIDNIDGQTNGTPVNRLNLMAMQGFESLTTIFNSDGSITETNAKGETMTTTFKADGSVVEAFVGGNGMTITKTTIFNADGSITEVVSE